MYSIFYITLQISSPLNSVTVKKLQIQTLLVLKSLFLPRVSLCPFCHSPPPITTANLTL
ncbi:hypothetical protein HanRHA438_Chr15g0716871 [Helianthus annuus]|nr:hypothetical protein HanRHA438_Chr15g0716871 [Helianthus annuus]